MKGWWNVKRARPETPASAAATRPTAAIHHTEKGKGALANQSALVEVALWLTGGRAYQRRASGCGNLIATNEIRNMDGLTDWRSVALCINTHVCGELSTLDWRFVMDVKRLYNITAIINYRIKKIQCVYNYIKPCYMYRIKLTETCYSTFALLLILIASIVLIYMSLWIKVSAKWLIEN